MSGDQEIEALEKFNEIIEKAFDEIPLESEWVEEATESESFSNKHANATMWAVAGDTFSPCEQSIKTLPPGQYTIEASPQRGIYFSKKAVNLDDLIHLPDSASEDVIEGIQSFWKKEEKFREFGFLWKRGVLLWGPPGSGKTSTLQFLSKQIVDDGGISVYITDPRLGADGLELLRRIEPKRPIIVMLEDIDAITYSYGEAAILALLDGELQIDNVVFIATTNYPEKLDKRLINRPSRFDIVKLIDMPSPEARKVYLSTKNPRLASSEADNELDRWVEGTSGFSIAHLKELIILVEVFDISLEDATSRLQAMMGHNPSSDSVARKKLGFT